MKNKVFSINIKYDLLRIFQYPPPQKILYDKMFSHFAASSAGAGDTKMKSSMDFWLSPWTTTEPDQVKDKRLFDHNSPNIMIYIFSNIESDALNYHTLITYELYVSFIFVGGGENISINELQL